MQRSRYHNVQQQSVRPTSVAHLKRVYCVQVFDTSGPKEACVCKWHASRRAACWGRHGDCGTAQQDTLQCCYAQMACGAVQGGASGKHVASTVEMSERWPVALKCNNTTSKNGRTFCKPKSRSGCLRMPAKKRTIIAGKCYCPSHIEIFSIHCGSHPRDPDSRASSPTFAPTRAHSRCFAAQYSYRNKIASHRTLKTHPAHHADAAAGQRVSWRGAAAALLYVAGACTRAQARAAAAGGCGLRNKHPSTPRQGA